MKRFALLQTVFLCPVLTFCVSGSGGGSGGGPSVGFSVGPSAAPSAAPPRLSAAGKDPAKKSPGKWEMDLQV